MFLETIHQFWKILIISSNNALSLSSLLCGPQLHIFRFSTIFHISLTLFPVLSIFFLCEFQSISFWLSYQSTIHLFSYVLPGMKFTTEFLPSITIVLSSRISIQLYMCVCVCVCVCVVYIYIFRTIYIYSSLKLLVTQSCPTLGDPMDCSPPGSSVNGILQARILEWLAIPFSRQSAQPWDWTWILYCLSHKGSPVLWKKSPNCHPISWQY